MAKGPTNDRRRASVDLLKRVCAPVAWHRFPTAAPRPLDHHRLVFRRRRSRRTSPAIDPRQTEKRFDDQQSGQAPNGAAALPLPQFARPEGRAIPGRCSCSATSPITGAVAIPQERLAATYQPYIGKKVSQADLAAIAAAVSDVYRAAGFHLSRAIVPPQDIQGGQLRIQVIEGSITELALKGDGAEQFGVRPMLEAVLAEQPSRLATLERQLLLINGRPGVRIEDTALEEIGTASGHFRLIVSLKTWHVFTSFGVDNLGSSSVGPWQSYATAAFNSYLAPGDSLVLNLSTTPGDPRQLAFGRLSYDVPVGTDGARIGASGYYSEVRPGDYRRLYSDNTKTESFEIRGSIVPLQSQKSSADADRGGRIQQCHRERCVRPDLRRSHPHRQPARRTTGCRTVSAAPTI